VKYVKQTGKNSVPWQTTDVLLSNYYKWPFRLPRS